MSKTSVSYVYDTMGSKLTENSTVNGVISRRDYVGGIKYSAPNVIERIATEEGYLLNSNGTYSFHYYLTDHLGNNRVVLKKGTSLTVPEIIQRQDYYPFGKTRSLVTGGNNRYLYNGKEVQKELGEHNLMMQFGGPKSFNPLSTTYNKIFSSGRKLVLF